MIRVVRILLWFFVFLAPWENVIVIPGLGTAAKIWGLAVGVVGLLAVLAKGRLRFHPFLLAGLLFVAWGWTSVLWSIEAELSVGRMLTYTGLWLMAWLIYHYGTVSFPSSLLQAYVLGAWVAALLTIQAYVKGITVVYQRFAAEGFDPNDLCIYLNLGIPFAAYLGFRARSALARLFCLFYIPVALVAILLTASRTGALGSAVALLFVLYHLRAVKMKWRLAGIFLLMGAAWATLTWVPQASLARISTILAEVRGGSLNERLNIWAAGLQVFATHPVLGVGAGTFSQAVEPILKEPRAPHNAFLAIAVEEGFVGLFLWLSLITLPFLKVLKFSPHERWLWLVTLAILLISFVSLNFEWRKVTWLMLAFAAAYPTRDILNPYLASREIV